MFIRIVSIRVKKPNTPYNTTYTYKVFQICMLSHKRRFSKKKQKELQKETGFPVPIKFYIHEQDFKLLEKDRCTSISSTFSAFFFYIVIYLFIVCRKLKNRVNIHNLRKLYNYYKSTKKGAFVTIMHSLVVDIDSLIFKYIGTYYSKRRFSQTFMESHLELKSNSVTVNTKNYGTFIIISVFCTIKLHQNA